MASVVSLLTKTINRLLPFATPGTPVLQDLLHLGALCLALYYAPQIQQFIRQRTNNSTEVPAQAQDEPENAAPIEPVPNAEPREAPQPAPQVRPDPVQLEQDGQEPEPELELDPAPAPGPANRPDRTREVGKKKAASLARRDQRRAYHEFQRQQGEIQRQRDAEGAEEREAIAALERERRTAAEEAVRAREAKEREERRAKENEAREAEMGRRERAMGLVRTGLEERGMVRLVDVGAEVGMEEGWVRDLIRVGGVLGERDGETTMLTETGWVVRIRKEDMEECYRRVLDAGDAEEGEGRVSFQRLGRVLEDVVRGRATAVAG